MSHNKYFDDAWQYLEEHHPTMPTVDALDMSIKPNIKKSEWCHYMGKVYDLLVIGQREGLITSHVDGHGCPVYWKRVTR